MAPTTTHTTKTKSGSSRATGEFDRCINACSACHALCITTMQYCLEQGGAHADSNHIRLLADCAQICQTSADFMLRHSPLHRETCRACAAVCTECSDDCEKMADDKTMQECAAACRKCADECGRMSSQTH